ncbi:MAG: lysostaphin resistance A-like protein [Candidatus Thorarchaeota archaeon]
MTIYEDKNEFLTFLTPALVSFGAALFLGVLQIVVIIALFAILMRFNEFTDPLYEPIWNLIILFLSQILATIIIFLWGIPWLKVKNVRQFPVNKYIFISVLFLICLTWAIIIVKTVIIAIVIDFFQLETPKTAAEALLIPKEILSPITIIIFFAPLIIGAPLFEELVYRRILIPLLEERGMTTAGAVLASSIFFTLLHLPPDLLYGNMTGTILHISSVGILALALGISYIKTRNIVYPILIHGVINGISAVPVVLIEGSDLAMLYEIFYLFIIVIIGILYLLYLLWSNLKDSKAINIEYVKSKISFNNEGFYGYLTISLGLLLLHTIVSIFMQVISALIINPIALIIIFILIRRTEYQKKRLSEYQMSQAAFMAVESNDEIEI